MNFDSMRDSLLASMAHMMRGVGAGSAGPSQEAQRGQSHLSAGQTCNAPHVGADHDQAPSSASSDDTGYVGGGLKVARTNGSESVTQGMVTTPAPPTFGGTSKLTTDEDGDLPMAS